MNLHFLISGDINTLSGDSLYLKRLADGLHAKGHKVFIHNLPGDFPFPEENSLNQCEIIFNSIPDGELVIVENNILSAIPGIIKKYQSKYKIAGLVHLPVSLRADLTILQKEIIAATEKEALHAIGGIVTSSHYIKNKLLAWNVDEKKIFTVVQGVDSFPLKKKYPRLPKKLLTVANYIRNKGFSHLIKALSAHSSKDWTLECYGDKNFDREYLSEIQLLISRNKLKDRIILNGPLKREALSKVYLDADLFIQPSDFEVHGMALSEALMHGLPVVASTGGAITDIVPSNMAKLFKPSDVYALQSILEELFENETLYNNLCKNAATYHLSAQSWEASVLQFEDILKKFK
jgi:glycosyltransferase involved in cell wall biosynthesis